MLSPAKAMGIDSHNITSPPEVSIIVPCRNEADCIEGCVRSILDQEPVLGGFELIVADSLSTDTPRMPPTARKTPTVMGTPIWKNF